MQWRRVYPVLRRGKPGAIALLVPVLAALIPFLLASDPLTGIRWASGILQVAGLFLVAVQLMGRASFFGSDGLLSRVRKWFSDLWGAIRGRPITMHARGSAVGVGGLKARGRAHIADDSHIVKKVAFLLQQVDRLHDRADAAEDRLEKEAKERKKAIADERKERIAGDSDLSEKVEGLAMGSYVYEWIGVLWLLVGIILGTWTDEIARLLG